MALPQQLKAARMTDSTLAKNIDDNVGALESALCDIFGFTADTDITESPLNCDNSGRITKALLRLANTAGNVGIRFRDTTNSKEFCLRLNNTSILLDENTGTEGSPSWTNRLTVNLTTGLPTLGTAADPSAANDLTRKAWIEANAVMKTGNQSITGRKTFSQVVLPKYLADTYNHDGTTGNYYFSEDFDDPLPDGLMVLWEPNENSHQASAAINLFFNGKGGTIKKYSSGGTVSNMVDSAADEASGKTFLKTCLYLIAWNDDSPGWICYGPFTAA